MNPGRYGLVMIAKGYGLLPCRDALERVTREDSREGGPIPIRFRVLTGSSGKDLWKGIVEGPRKRNSWYTFW